MTEAHHEASRWIARLEAADVLLEDHQRFRDWLSASPENRAAYEAVSRTWDKLDTLKLLSPSPTGQQPTSTRVSRRTMLIGGGAVALAGSAAVAFWALTPSTTFAATYETPTGGRETAALQDGSQIELNADTSVRVAFTDRTRTATLERGEALFTVADDRRKFEIHTPFGSLVAEGTLFLVKVGPGLARVSVLQGRVSGRGLTAGSGIAEANQELVLSRRAVELTPLATERVESRLAWRDHMLAFDGETLAEAAADVERQTGVRFSFAAADIADLRVGGYINGNDAEAFVALIQENLELSTQRQSDGSFVVSR